MTWPRALRIDAPDAPSGWWGEVWPIGAVYFSAIDQNPAVPLGFGTWEPFGVGHLLMGSNALVMNSIVTAPPSVVTTPMPVVAVFCFQRVA